MLVCVCDMVIDLNCINNTIVIIVIIYFCQKMQSKMTECQEQ